MRREIVIPALVASLIIVLGLAGCSGDQAAQLSKFTCGDIKGAALAARAAGDTPALGCFGPLSEIPCDQLPGAAVLIEADRLCKGILPKTFP